MMVEYAPPTSCSKAFIQNLELESCPPTSDCSASTSGYFKAVATVSGNHEATFVKIPVIPGSYEFVAYYAEGNAASEATYLFYLESGVLVNNVTLTLTVSSSMAFSVNTTSNLTLKIQYKLNASDKLNSTSQRLYYQDKYSHFRSNLCVDKTTCTAIYSSVCLICRSDQIFDSARKSCICPSGIYLSRDTCTACTGLNCHTCSPYLTN